MFIKKLYSHSMPIIASHPNPSPICNGQYIEDDLGCKRWPLIDVLSMCHDPADDILCIGSKLALEVVIIPNGDIQAKSKKIWTAVNNFSNGVQRGTIVLPKQPLFVESIHYLVALEVVFNYKLTPQFKGNIRAREKKPKEDCVAAPKRHFSSL